MFQKFRNAVAPFVATGVMLAMTSPAFAVIDTTDALAEVDAAKAFVTTIGLAVLALIFTVKGIKWARKGG